MLFCILKFYFYQELGGSQSAYSLQDQLKINSNFCDQKYPTLEINDIINLTEKLRKEWKVRWPQHLSLILLPNTSFGTYDNPICSQVLSICDIVLNHTSNESSWLQDHPECTYNMVNCPYLKPAYLLDITLFNFSMEVSKGIWELNGIPEIVCNEEHLGVSDNSSQLYVQLSSSVFHF